VDLVRKPVTLSLPTYLIQRLDELADAGGVSRSEIATRLMTADLPYHASDNPANPAKPLAPRRRGRPPKQVVHEPVFKPRRKTSRNASTVSLGYAACECGWSSDKLVSEAAARRNAATHVRKMTEAAAS